MYYSQHVEKPGILLSYPTSSENTAIFCKSTREVEMVTESGQLHQQQVRIRDRRG